MKALLVPIMLTVSLAACTSNSVRTPSSEPEDKSGQVGNRFLQSNDMSRTYCYLAGTNRVSIKISKDFDGLKNIVGIWDGGRGEMQNQITDGKDGVVTIGGDRLVATSNDRQKYISLKLDSDGKHGKATVKPAIEGKNKFDVECTAGDI